MFLKPKKTELRLRSRWKQRKLHMPKVTKIWRLNLNLHYLFYSAVPFYFGQKVCAVIHWCIQRHFSSCEFQ